MEQLLKIKLNYHYNNVNLNNFKLFIKNTIKILLMNLIVFNFRTFFVQSK